MSSQAQQEGLARSSSFGSSCFIPARPFIASSIGSPRPPAVSACERDLTHWDRTLQTAMDFSV